MGETDITLERGKADHITSMMNNNRLKKRDKPGLTSKEGHLANLLPN